MKGGFIYRICQRVLDSVGSWGLGWNMDPNPELQKARHQIPQQWQGGQSIMVLDPVKSVSWKVQLKAMQSSSQFIPCWHVCE